MKKKVKSTKKFITPSFSEKQLLDIIKLAESGHTNARLELLLHNQSMLNLKLIDISDKLKTK